MVCIETTRESNARAKDFLSDLVAVFVGATGGIGRSTAKELFIKTERPRLYIVGRNEERGKTIVDELKSLNPEGEVIFLKHDISLLRNVDWICDEIKKREKKVNMLLCSAGYMTLKSRDETAERIDKKMAVNYYSRFRFATNLLPLLNAAADAGELSRFISVLAAGSEADVDVEYLELKEKFTVHRCLAHCVMMTDFMVEELAKRHPRISFSHSYPGTVKTGIANELPPPVRLAIKVLFAIMTPWILNLHEAGERHFFQLTSLCYPPAMGGTGVPVPPDLRVMKGMDDHTGSGGYLLNWDGEETGDSRFLSSYREMGFGQKVWDHTHALYHRVLSAKRKADQEAEKARTGPPPRVDDPIGWRAG
ncbi:hypothetical protein LTR50_001301 [Elasticomyces elasticus]|nr:hypothetical protein LTR50_001301 [Elasticomyces elasticus]